MVKKLNIQAKILFVVGGVVLLFIGILTVYNTISSRRLALDLSIDVMNKEALYEGERAYATFTTITSRVQGLGRVVEGLLEEGRVNLDEYNAILDGYIKRVNKGQVVGLGLSIEAGIISQKLYSRYVSYGSRGELLPPTEYDDFTFSGAFYTEPLKTGKPYLGPLYNYELSNGDKEYIFTYSVPIIKNGKPVGSILIDIHGDLMYNFIKDIFVFDVGELTLIGPAGNILGLSMSGESEKDVREKYLYKNIKDLDWWQDLDLINAMKNNKEVSVTRLNAITKTYDVYKFVPINMVEGVNWGLMVQVPLKQLTVKADMSRNISIIVAIAIIIILAIIIIYVIKSIIVAPIKYAVEEVEHIAKGDLTKESNAEYLKRGDEIGTLIQAFDKMKKDIAEIVSNINSAASEISSAASEVSQGNEDLSHRTESQAASLEETASSMEEMASTIKSSAEHSLEGNKMMIESKEAVAGAGTIIDSTTKNIEEVLEASTKISDITKMIESIALQTNILALNAAVEAARAGEQGRGFAVVASEVRNLAQTTQTSVKDITTLIVDVNDKIKKATDSAHESKVIFDDIQKKITHTAEIMQDISSTAVEQQSGVDQINKAVTDMDIVTQQNAALVEESSAAAESLSAQAKDLVDVISFFKVKSTKEHVSNLFDGSKNGNVNKHAKSLIKSPLKNKQENNQMEIREALSPKPKNGASEFGSTMARVNNGKDEYESF